MMRLSVLFVTNMYPHPEQPGNGAFVMHQAQQLRALGHDVDVVHVRGYESRLNYLKGAADVCRATRRTRYDIVHVHYGLSGLCALWTWRTPVVVTLHGGDVLEGRLQPLVSRFVSACAAATIVVSPAIADRCPGTLIPCGVDLDRFRPIDRAGARETLGLELGRKYVLFPFAPDRQVKRWDIASAAVGLLKEEGLDVTLLPVWSVPNERMPLYYSAADVMVLCSDSEGSPTSIKEALACHLPVVSTPVGDVPNLLSDVGGAELCEQNARSIARALRRVLTNGVPSSDGRAAMKRYSQAATAEAVLGVYASVLRKPLLDPSPDSCV